MPQEQAQDESRATMAPKIKKGETHLSFDRPASEVHRHIRAFSPAPGAYALWKGKRLKLLRSRLDPVLETADRAGRVIVSSDRRSLGICCAASSVLWMDAIQPEGGRTLGAQDFLNGHPDIVGEVLA
jgi:methionyl-tRNA formyltransferase